MFGVEAELFVDFEEDEVIGDDDDDDDELRTAYPCPFCEEDFDLLELCCHIDLDHQIEAKSGVQLCPVCAVWIGANMVEHIAAQHGNIFKSQLKSKRHQHDSYPTLSFSRKDEEDRHWESFYAGSSPVTSTSETARDPLLSFLCGAAAAGEHQNVQPDSSSELSIEETHSDDTVLERDVEPSLPDKDRIEKARRSKFVQGLLMSTFLDPDL